ncbi:ABC transporter permease [candidate division KSB1 bacterium]|nr:ABC transporter permease [candidate division KSB1 bacterium]RQW05791.1 MAG: ABC transporter permease [candidate division KSB1 bacterium]
MADMKATFGQSGRQLAFFFVHIARMVRLAGHSFVWIFVAPFKGKKLRWGATFVQMVRIGVESVPIVGVISFCVGLIIAMQAAYQLEKFGATIYVADLVSVTMCRELGPLITAIIVSGRSGSAIAAEIGTMKVSEEIDALQTMALNPIGFLVVPRLLAMMIVVPCLTVLSDFVGIAGGFVLALTNLKLAFVAYFNQTAEALYAKDFITGLIKSFFFAIIIAQVGAYQGFNVTGGAEGVGKSTTTAVVVSIFLVIFADLLFTMLFYSTL